MCFQEQRHTKVNVFAKFVSKPGDDSRTVAHYTLRISEWASSGPLAHAFPPTNCVFCPPDPLVSFGDEASVSREGTGAARSCNESIVPDLALTLREGAAGKVRGQEQSWPSASDCLQPHAVEDDAREESRKRVPEADREGSARRKSSRKVRGCRSAMAPFASRAHRASSFPPWATRGHQPLTPPGRGRGVQGGRRGCFLVPAQDS